MHDYQELWLSGGVIYKGQHQEILGDGTVLNIDYGSGYKIVCFYQKFTEQYTKDSKCQDISKKLAITKLQGDSNNQIAKWLKLRVLIAFEEQLELINTGGMYNSKTTLANNFTVSCKVKNKF